MPGARYDADDRPMAKPSAKGMQTEAAAMPIVLRVTSARTREVAELEIGANLKTSTAPGRFD